jgi:hypothetical protein
VKALEKSTRMLRRVCLLANALLFGMIAWWGYAGSEGLAWNDAMRVLTRPWEWFEGIGNSKMECYLPPPTKGDLAGFLHVLELEKNSSGRYPTQEEGLDILWNEAQTGTEKRRRKWFERKIVDAWGRAYQYRIPAVRSRAGFDIYSLGPDGLVSADDVGNWE